MPRAYKYGNGIKGSAAAHVDPMLSQYEVAKLLGITRSRVSQLEQQALCKIKTALLRQATAAGQNVRDYLFDCQP
jgi:predicted XRE-type DNA-binding protein